jgi:hypothetical protein
VFINAVFINTQAQKHKAHTTSKVSDPMESTSNSKYNDTDQIINSCFAVRCFAQALAAHFQHVSTNFADFQVLVFGIYHQGG